MIHLVNFSLDTFYLFIKFINIKPVYTAYRLFGKFKNIFSCNCALQFFLERTECLIDRF